MKKKTTGIKRNAYREEYSDNIDIDFNYDDADNEESSDELSFIFDDDSWQVDEPDEIFTQEQEKESSENSFDSYTHKQAPRNESHKKSAKKGTSENKYPVFEDNDEADYEADSINMSADFDDDYEKSELSSKKNGLFAANKHKEKKPSKREKQSGQSSDGVELQKQAVQSYRTAKELTRLSIEARNEVRLGERHFLSKFITSAKLSSKAKTARRKAKKLSAKYKHSNKLRSSNVPTLTKILLVADVFFLLCFAVFYGPIDFVRDTYVTTAMKTMTHRYLAHIFYSEKTIERIVSENTITESIEATDANAITFTNVDDIVSYSSVYEEQVLKKDEGNDLYKLIPIEGSSWEGHIVVVYDASKVDLVLASGLNSGGQLTSEMAKDNNAIIAINGGGFSRSGSVVRPKRNFIMNGKVRYSTGATGKLIGMTNDNVLVLLKATAEDAVKQGVRDAVEFGPFLIVNGKAATFTGDGGYGKRSRTAIAQRQDGIILMVVIDGKWNGTGISMPDLTSLLAQYKAYNAANLDGGGSSTLVINKKLINNPAGWGYTGERYVTNAWIVK